jgi:hypothetical protein
VFPARYELDLYILFRTQSVVKGLSTGSDVLCESGHAGGLRLTFTYCLMIHALRRDVGLQGSAGLAINLCFAPNLCLQ